MQGKVSELDNDFLVIYYHKHQELSDIKMQIQNMILKIYFLMDMIIVCGHKMKIK